MNSKIFRAYDIRGNAARDLTDETVRNIGRAFASMVDERAPAGESAGEPITIAVGRDCRLSSPRIAESLTKGLIAGGAKVIDIGIGPSPLLYFAAHELASSGAIIITGSHNDAPDNGFKLLIGRSTLHTEDIAELGRRAATTMPDCDGGSREQTAVESSYLEAGQRSIGELLRPLKVVVDAGNGTGGPLATTLYRRLGCTVVELYCEMDGAFPNHHPDPTVPENLAKLQEMVLEHGADLGVAFDGDADRLGAVDNRGRIIPGDRLLLLFGSEIAKRTPGARIIGEVKCSTFVFEHLDAAGAKSIMWKVGHSLIKAKMKEENALLAGEMSGHFFFADRYLGFDDGIYAGARLMKLVASQSRSFAELIDAQPVAYATPEIRVPTKDPKLVVEAIADVVSNFAGVTQVISIDGIRVQFADGWGLARASNTEAVIVVRAEGASEARCEEISTLIQETIKRCAESR